MRPIIPLLSGLFDRTFSRWGCSFLCLLGASVVDCASWFVVILLTLQRVSFCFSSYSDRFAALDYSCCWLRSLSSRSCHILDCCVNRRHFGRVHRSPSCPPSWSNGVLRLYHRSIICGWRCPNVECLVLRVSRREFSIVVSAFDRSKIFSGHLLWRNLDLPRVKSSI